MRLWTIDFSFLDSKGLVALWREALLAQACLAGKTRGYNNHPQLTRFKAENDPLASMGSYLNEIAHEATRRGFKFNSEKILKPALLQPTKASIGQLRYEYNHLQRKLEARCPEQFKRNRELPVKANSSTVVTAEEEIESWEKIS